ncbi:MAG: 4Fe-4S dicluster domain-containing protein [Bacteroidia bacterium]
MKKLPRDNCKEEAGQLIPIVDLNKCESKGPCISACPYDVFEMKEISNEEYSSLSFVGKLKTRYHGREKAIVVRPEKCHACGLCVTSCPEHAIKLTKVR